MSIANHGYIRWYIRTLRRQYKQAKILQQIRRENPTLTIAEDVKITNPQNLFLGKNIVIQKGTILHCGGESWSDYRGKITIGDNCEIGPYCILYGAGEIEIKCGSGIAMGSRILSQQLDISRQREEGNDLSTSAIPLKFEKVVLEEGVWLGADAIILPGVTLGRGCCITPGAIIHKNIPPFKMAYAPPARVIKSAPPERKSEEG